MLGHCNRVNALEHYRDHIFSSSNDCTVREWQINNGVCINVFKFADPVSVARIVN